MFVLGEGGRVGDSTCVALSVCWSLWWFDLLFITCSCYHTPWYKLFLEKASNKGEGVAMVVLS